MAREVLTEAERDEHDLLYGPYPEGETVPVWIVEQKLGGKWEKWQVLPYDPTDYYKNFPYYRTFKGTITKGAQV